MDSENRGALGLLGIAIGLAGGACFLAWVAYLVVKALWP